MKRSEILSNYLFAKIDYENHINDYQNNYLKIDLQNILNRNVIEIYDDIFYEVFPNGYTKFEIDNMFEIDPGYIPAFIVNDFLNYSVCYFYNFNECKCCIKVISKEEYNEYNMKIRLKKINTI